MASDWPKKKLGDLFKVKHGFAFRGEYFANVETPYLLTTPGNFSIGGGFQNDKPKFYSGPVPEDYILNAGDVIVTMTDLSKASDTLGNAAIIPEDENIWLHNQRVGLLEFKDPSETCPQFFSYLLRSHEYRSWIVGSATGTTVKHTSPSRISEFSCPIPSLPEQKAIAHILGSLDDKIELNRRMNETLEGMAQALFKSWFVDFDPVIDNALEAENPIPEEFADRAETRRQALRANDECSMMSDEFKNTHNSEFINQHSPVCRRGRPQALFPDSFQTSELGPIPTGWEVSIFGDLASAIRESVNPSDLDADIPCVGLEHIGRKKMYLSDWGHAGDVDSNKSAFQAGDVLFGKLRPYFHKVCIMNFSGVCSTDILVFRAKEECWKGFVQYQLFDEEFVEYANARSTGTRMPRASWKDIVAYQIAKPSSDVAERFAELVAGFNAKAMLNVESASKLTKLRDTLLPKLISGEVRTVKGEG